MIKTAIMGYGTIGSGVAEVLEQNLSLIHILSYVDNVYLKLSNSTTASPAFILYFIPVSRSVI